MELYGSNYNKLEARQNANNFSPPASREFSLNLLEKNMLRDL